MLAPHVLVPSVIKCHSNGTKPERTKGVELEEVEEDLPPTQDSFPQRHQQVRLISTSTRDTGIAFGHFVTPWFNGTVGLRIERLAPQTGGSFSTAD